MGKHIQLFEEFVASLNNNKEHITKATEDTVTEGAIPVFPAGNPWKAEGSIPWTGVSRNVGKWLKDGIALSIVAEFDYDKRSADPRFRSEVQRNWDDKNLPLFTEKNKRYDNSEFDIVEIVENPDRPDRVYSKEKVDGKTVEIEHAREPWVRVEDKKGNQFLIHPAEIIDIQKGSSVREGILSGHAYLVDNQRAIIKDYKNGIVYLKTQDGKIQEIPVEQWKTHKYLELD